MKWGGGGGAWLHTYQPPEYKNFETSKNLRIVKMSFSTISEYSLKITRSPSECSRQFLVRTAIAIDPINEPTFYHVLCNLIG